MSEWNYNIDEAPKSKTVVSCIYTIGGGNFIVHANPVEAYAKLGFVENSDDESNTIDEPVTSPKSALQYAELIHLLTEISHNEELRDQMIDALGSGHEPLWQTIHPAISAIYEKVNSELLGCQDN